MAAFVLSLRFLQIANKCFTKTQGVGSGLLAGRRALPGVVCFINAFRAGQSPAAGHKA
jgi:hypothetical protein